MAAETGFLIDGKLYEVPTRDSFGFDEWQVMYEYAELTYLDFLPADENDPEPDEVVRDRQRRLGSPALQQAIVHIAYQRGNPKLSAAKVKATVADLNPLEVFAGLLGEPKEEGDALPPASTTEPARSSPKSSSDSDNSLKQTSERHGLGSTNDSDEQDEPHASTGPSRLVTSSISPHEISAA